MVRGVQKKRGFGKGTGTSVDSTAAKEAVPTEGAQKPKLMKSTKKLVKVIFGWRVRYRVMQSERVRF